MGDVLSFDRNRPRVPQQRGKTLVIEEDTIGDYIVRMSPALTDVERAVTSVHKTIEEARAVARHARQTYPDLYTATVDKTLPDLGGAA